MATANRIPSFAGREAATISNEAWSSGVSWGAVIAGAFAASALGLILLTLGAGMGLSAASPWSGNGAVASFGKVAIFWLIIVQILASAMGGYLTGRLRTRWLEVHTHEVYFRDTANGFLAWSVSLVVTAAFLAGAVAAASTSSPTSGQGTPQTRAATYFADSLFRSTQASSKDPATIAEADNILTHDIAAGQLSAADRAYLGETVAARTGMNPTAAEERVLDTFAAEQTAANAVRKEAAHSLYWTFIALLIGAFCASYAATIGGRQRDKVMQREF